ncbi:hypothetical protein K488DRAFT_71724 [Vararia minispora EC-137]|uniref:Uncharacterized protein n=1 Tax=Vararia minispora EC-137 TaxID=1314806 RepID=A0ACB8QHG6_9AGAM|nr:hypothetical protein K488DRAFT_71724 [Vararia minispora EC-137]
MPQAVSFPLLGLVCVADVENIFSVMASASHQRRILGVAEQPVIGFAFDPLGFGIQLMVSWFDVRSTSEDYCLIFLKKHTAATQPFHWRVGKFSQSAYRTVQGYRRGSDDITHQRKRYEVGNGVSNIAVASRKVTLELIFHKFFATSTRRPGPRNKARSRSSLRLWDSFLVSGSIDQPIRSASVQVVADKSMVPSTAWLSKLSEKCAIYSQYTRFYGLGPKNTDGIVHSSIEADASVFEHDCEVVPFPNKDLSWLSELLERPCIATSLHRAIQDVQHCKSIDMGNEDTCGENAWRASWDMVIGAIVDELSNQVTDASIYYILYDHSPKPSAWQVYPIGDKLQQEHISERSLVNLFQRTLQASLVPNAKRLRVATLWQQIAANATAVWNDIVRAWGHTRDGRTSEPVERDEPRTARCDSLLMIKISDFFDGQVVSKDWVSRFELITASPRPVKDLRTGVDHAALRQIDPTDNEAVAQSSFRNGLACCISASMHHFPMSSPATPEAVTHDIGKSMRRLKVDDEVLLLALRITCFICEFKPTLLAAEKSVAGQAYLDIVAAVKFLAFLGIVEFPVFGLVMEGAVGYVIMAWGEKILEKPPAAAIKVLGDGYDERRDIRVRIIDRHPVAFDLGTEVGAYHFACFVAKVVHDLTPELVRKVKEKREEFNERVHRHGPADPSLAWNMVQVWREKDLEALKNKNKKDAVTTATTTTEIETEAQAEEDGW